MNSPLIRQARVVPLAAILVPMLIGFALPGYSSLSQHLSELELLHHPVATITRAGSILCGASILLFGLGLVLEAPRRHAFTALCAAVAGVAMASNGVFASGHPLHGLHGLALFLALVPACFAAGHGASRLATLSLAASVLALAYFWLQLSGFDPPAWRGLTQRIAVVVMFGWYTIAAFGMRRAGTVSSRANAVPIAEPA